MSRRARFRVPVSVDRASLATVEIDRGALLLTVRLHKRRRVDVIPLSMVAEWVWWRFTKARAAELLAARKARRAARR